MNDEIHPLIKEWLEKEDQIRKLKDDIAKIKDEILNIDENLKYEYSPVLTVIAGKKKKAVIHNDQIFDLLSIDSQDRDLFSSNCFKIGQLKKNEGFDKCWKEIWEEKVELKKIDPTFLQKKMNENKDLPQMRKAS